MMRSSRIKKRVMKNEGLVATKFANGTPVSGIASELGLSNARVYEFARGLAARALWSLGHQPNRLIANLEASRMTPAQQRPLVLSELISARVRAKQRGELTFLRAERVAKARGKIVCCDERYDEVGEAR